MESVRHMLCMMKTWVMPKECKQNGTANNEAIRS